ncbi:PaaI family thioesterase [Nocardia wallacei]|uniref:PaaI family thioesterase n=1 Tax=Nocardia wallacei TaxID=480035 RepID=UPI0024569B53|nr:PaaI family thioesterase [Nocardia wallacei]
MAPTQTESVEAIGELLDHIGFRSARDSDGTRIWELPVAPHVVNTSGGLQGGLIATLADIAAGTLALDLRPPNGGVVTSDLSVRYFRAITGGTARALSKIVHAGKRSIVVQVEVIGMPGRELAALAMVSFATVEFATNGTDVPRNAAPGGRS